MLSRDLPDDSPPDRRSSRGPTKPGRRSTVTDISNTSRRQSENYIASNGNMDDSLRRLIAELDQEGGDALSDDGLDADLGFDYEGGLLESPVNGQRSPYDRGQRLSNGYEDQRLSNGYEDQSFGIREHNGMDEMDAAVSEANYQERMRFEQFRTSAEEEIASLKDTIAQLQRRLSTSQPQQTTSTPDFRAALSREKDLELLQLKKEIWQEKERQLTELRGSMLQEKNRMERELEEQLRTRDDEIGYLRSLVDKETRDIAVQASDGTDDAVRLLKDFLGSEESGIEDLAHIAVDTISAREELIQRQADELDSREALIEEMRREQPAILLSKIREVEKELEGHFNAHLENEGKRHQDELARTREQHDEELRELREEAEKRLEEAERVREELEERLRKPPSLTVDELVDVYPEHVDALRGEWDARWSSEVRELKDDFAARERQHASELQKTKEQCASSYATAVSRLKDEFSNLERRLGDRHRDELERWRSEREEMRRNHEMEVRDVIERARVDPGGGLKRELKRAEEELGEQERVIRSLKDALAISALEHSQAIGEVKRRAESENAKVLARVKDKYLTTLRAMRADIEAARVGGQERLEREWRGREERMNEDWGARIDSLRDKYEKELRRYRGTSDGDRRR